MNYKIAMVPLLLAGLLASCNDSEELVKTNPDYVEAGYGALTLTLKYLDSPKTRAVGDTLVGVAYPEEKKIKSVAFFVDTEAETADGIEMYGAFGGYFSDEEVLSPIGLQEELEEVTAGTPGKYTAKIRHRSDGWANPKVIVIANYLENGLADDLKAVSNWDELQKVVSKTISQNPKSPLLMYSTKTIDAWKRVGGGNGGGAASAEFDMDRLVSRIDIHNNAYDKTTPSNGFVLTSAQLVRPKMASYLLPDIVDLPTLPVSDVTFAVSGTVVEEGNAPNIIQKLDSLYAYENDNVDADKATAVQINGTYRGGKISKVIDFKKADGVGTTGDPIALARNHRYVVNINAAPDSTDIEWNIVVKEWSESDTIKVKPVYIKPDLAEALKTAVFDAGTSGVTWTTGSKVIDMTNATAGDATLKFSTSGTTASVVKLAYAFDTDASSISGKSDAIVKVDDAIVTYGAAKVETPITITIPQQNSDEKVPLDIYVIVANGGNLSVCDTITIKSRPDFNGLAGLKPVLMKAVDGKEFYWAPVNLGATKIATAITAATNQAAWDALSQGQRDAAFEQCGYYYQWGRKKAFKMGTASEVKNDTANVATIGWPTKDTYPTVDNDASAWKEKFIIAGTIAAHGRNTQYNWLLFEAGQDNPAGGDMAPDAWYQKLWDANAVGGNKQTIASKTTADPCPKGWRVPTIAEWEAIGAGNTSITKEWDATNKIMKIAGVGSDKLVLPAAGYRSSSSGASSGMGSTGYYWSSSVPLATANASYVGFYDATLTSGTSYRAGCLLVRCIQE